MDDEEQISVSFDDDDDISDAGSVSEETGPPYGKYGFFARDGLVSLEGGAEHDLIKKIFLVGMGQQSKDTDVVAIHKNSSSSLTTKARLDAFRIFLEAVAKKCGGDANKRYAWYAGTRDEIREIVKHGFSQCGRPSQGQTYGVGLQLFSAMFSIDGALSSEVDEDGLRHVLLCRVILGNMEVVAPGAKQFHPSSQNFDSGVDNLSAPRRYIVWSAYMNSHVLPVYIVTFKTPRRLNPNILKSSGQCISFPALLSVLSRSLDPSAMALITELYKDFRESKITRLQFMQILRHTAGDELLTAILERSHTR